MVLNQKEPIMFIIVNRFYYPAPKLKSRKKKSYSMHNSFIDDTKFYDDPKGKRFFEETSTINCFRTTTFHVYIYVSNMHINENKYEIMLAQR